MRPAPNRPTSSKSLRRTGTGEDRAADLLHVGASCLQERGKGATESDSELGPAQRQDFLSLASTARHAINRSLTRAGSPRPLPMKAAVSQAANGREIDSHELPVVFKRATQPSANPSCENPSTLRPTLDRCPALGLHCLPEGQLCMGGYPPNGQSQRVKREILRWLGETVSQNTRLLNNTRFSTSPQDLFMKYRLFRR